MTALMIDSPWAIGIIVIAALLLFGGTRLAGLGKSAGRAIKEFKDETTGVLDSGKPEDEKTPEVTDQTTAEQQTPAAQQAPAQNTTNQQAAAPQQNAEQN